MRRRITGIVYAQATTRDVHGQLSCKKSEAAWSVLSRRCAVVGHSALACHVLLITNAHDELAAYAKRGSVSLQSSEVG